jgi:hypothetical protein
MSKALLALLRWAATRKSAVRKGQASMLQLFAQAMPVIAAPQAANRWLETDRGMIARLPTPVAADLPRLP